MKNTKAITYGYARVSHRDQNAERQIRALKNAGIDEKYIFTDKQSGKDFDRPQYQKLMSMLYSNTVLYILSVDRLGRNYDEVLEQWRIITKEKGANIVVMDMPLLDTRHTKDRINSYLSQQVLLVLSFVSETERENIRQRQSEGIKVAIENGVRFGRPEIPLPPNFEECRLKYEKGEMTLSEVANACGMARTTFYRKTKK